MAKTAFDRFAGNEGQESSLALGAEVAVGFGLFWACQSSFAGLLGTSSFIVSSLALLLTCVAGCADLSGRHLLAMFERPAVIVAAYALYAMRLLLAPGAPLPEAARLVAAAASSVGFGFLLVTWYYIIGSRVRHTADPDNLMLIAATCLVASTTTTLVQMFTPTLGVVAPVLVRAVSAGILCHIVSAAPVLKLNVTPQPRRDARRVLYRPEAPQLAAIVTFAALFSMRLARYPFLGAMSTSSTWALLGDMLGPLVVAAMLLAASGLPSRSHAPRKERADGMRSMAALFSVVTTLGLVAVGYGFLSGSAAEAVFSFAHSVFFVTFNAYTVRAANAATSNYRSVFVSCLIVAAYAGGTLAGGALTAVAGGSMAASQACAFVMALLVVASTLLLAAQGGRARRSRGAGRAEQGQAAAALGEGDPQAPRAQAAPSSTEESERLAALYGLSPRETDVLRYLLQGWPHKKIAEKLVIAPGTVKAHVKKIYEKAGVHSRSELLDLRQSGGTRDAGDPEGPRA